MFPFSCVTQNLKQGLGKSAYSKLESKISILFTVMLIESCLYCLSVADFTHCGNMTEAMEIYEACMSTIAAKAEILHARKTWLLVIIILAVTICIASLILFLFHRRNKRKNQKKKVSINNNTHQKGVSPPEEQEISSDEMLNEPIS